MIFCLSAIWSEGQQTEPGWSVQVSGGVAAPVGDFGKKNGVPDNSISSSGNARWAKTGPLVNLYQIKGSQKKGVSV